MTGMTVHDLSQELDAGDVVHQNAVDLVKGDGIHDLACRAVFGLGKELPKLKNLGVARQGRYKYLIVTMHSIPCCSY